MRYEPFTRPPLTGVGGWLQWLCIGLTIGGPLNWIRLSMTDYHGIQRMIAAYPPLRTAYVLATLTTGAVTLFGLYAGIQLWRERRGAVTVARRYFVLLPFVPLASAIPYAILPGVTVHLKVVAESFLCALILAVLWYSYLRRSIRVENTFPEAFPAPVRPPESSPPPTS